MMRAVLGFVRNVSFMQAGRAINTLKQHPHVRTLSRAHTHTHADIDNERAKNVRFI